MASYELDSDYNSTGWVPDAGAPPIDHAPFIHDQEAGFISLRAAAIVGVIGALGVGSYLVGAHNGEPWLSVTANDSSSHVTAKEIALKPIKLDCRAQQVYDLAGSVVKFQATVMKHQIPQVGASVTFEDPSKVVRTTCMTNVDTYMKDVKFEHGALDPTTGYGHETIKIPLNRIESNVQYPADNKRLEVNDYSGLKIGGGITEIFSGVAQGLCVTATLDKFPQQCEDFAKHFNAYKSDLESNGTRSAEDAVLHFVQKQGGINDWQQIKAAIRDSYVEEAISNTHNPNIANDITVEFVDSQGNATDALPNFNADVFDSLRKEGIIQSHGAIDTDVDTSNFHIVRLTKPYIAKYPVNPAPAVIGATR